MAKRASVPKFGSWDGGDIGYTVCFDKVRENKGAAPAQAPAVPGSKEGVPVRPVSSHGHREAQRAHGRERRHRRAGSGDGGSSAASEGAGWVRAQHSKFAPPQPYHPRGSNYPAHGGYGAYGVPAPRQQQVAPARSKASAVPRFGVWDEQNGGAGGAQGFTVQFEKVKRNKEAARAAVPEVLPPQPSPELAPPRRACKTSPLCLCLFPIVKE